VILNSMVPFSYLCLLPYFSNLKKGKGRGYRAITKISLISYSMYLINLNIVYWIMVKNIPWSIVNAGPIITPYLNFLAFWVFTITLSIGLYKYYEVPMMSFRDKKT